MLSPSLYLFIEAQGQLEQLLDEAQLLAAFIQETEQLSHVEAIRVLPEEVPCFYETPGGQTDWLMKIKQLLHTCKEIK